MSFQDGDSDKFVQHVRELCPGLGIEDGSRKVTDVDEEIFLLYTLSSPPLNRQGLGQLNEKCDTLSISVDLYDVCVMPTVSITNDGEDVIDRKLSKPSKVRIKGRSTTKKDGNASENDKTLTVTVKQDLTSLRTTKGDTGSVVWRSSVYLAAKVLHDITASQRHVARPINSTPFPFILSPDLLSQARILELGSGTGILPAMILTHPFFSTSNIHWIASDQAQILPLLRKNVEKLSDRGICASAKMIDWLEASKVYCKGSTSALHSFRKDILQMWSKDDSEALQYPDIIFATDCIFNPHLFNAFLDTLTFFTLPRQTIVMVVCELRQADMMQDFLQAWLNHQGRWSIHTVESQEVLGPHLAHGSVIWIGWRSE